MKKNIILFGASSLGKKAYSSLKDEYEIICFCDNSEQKWGREFCGISIISPQTLKEYTNKATVIIASSYINEILDQLTNIGIEDIEIFSCANVFGEMRYFLKESRHYKKIYKQDYKIKKIVFIADGDIDFCIDIVKSLEKQYEVKLVYSKDEEDINEAIKWADLCWFEWCGNLLSYYSNLEILKHKKVIARLHLYELYISCLHTINWDSVDKIIFVAQWVKDAFTEKMDIDDNKTLVIPNIFDVNPWRFCDKEKGFNIAVVGSVTCQKNIPTLIQFFYELYKVNNKYKLYVATISNEEMIYNYVLNFIKKFNLQNNVFICGKIEHDKLSEWFEDKQYILSSAISESQGINILEGMACGLKPIINYFPGIECLYPEKYIYYTLKDFIKKIEEQEIESYDYRKFVENNFNKDETLLQIDKLILKL